MFEVKFLYGLVILAVFQYATADETIKAASTIIESEAPQVVKDVLNTFDQVYQNLPPAERVDKLMDIVAKNFDKILKQGEQTRKLLIALRDHSTSVVIDIANNMLTAAQNTVARAVQNPATQDIVKDASGIVDEVKDSVNKIADVAAEVTNSFQKLSEPL